jgi:hypothetical protein
MILLQGSHNLHTCFRSAEHLGDSLQALERAVLAPCCDPTILAFGSLAPLSLHQYATSGEAWNQQQRTVTVVLVPTSRDVSIPGEGGYLLNQGTDRAAPFDI